MMGNEFFNAAKEKLDAGVKEKLDRYGEVMKRDVHDALLDFCRQDGEFAQAVAQGGSFKDCMAAVAKKIDGHAISDMKAYGAAVEFYFPGATIDVKMTIDLCGSVRKDEPERAAVIDLSSFF